MLMLYVAIAIAIGIIGLSCMGTGPLIMTIWQRQGVVPGLVVFVIGILLLTGATTVWNDCVIPNELHETKEITICEKFPYGERLYAATKDDGVLTVDSDAYGYLPASGNVTVEIRTVAIYQTRHISEVRGITTCGNRTAGDTCAAGAP